MRIERLSENQIKFVLSQSDLQEHGIRLEDLSTATAKTQKLFRKMLEQAMEECSFSADNIPLMVEAVPVGADGIMVIVTKMPGGDPADAPITLYTQNKDPRRFKRTGFLEEPEPVEEDTALRVYSFAALDEAAGAAVRISPLFHGDSDLYKYKGRYFLVLQSHSLDEPDLDLILEEYGLRHVSSPLSKYHLMEYGESLIARDAVDVLTEHLA